MCTFAKMKFKSPILIVCSIVLVISYVMSIGGINVHTCSHTGESFVTLLIEGTSCSDIHPDHHHEHCACCHHDEHHAGCEDENDGDEEGCCHNDSHILLLTGDSDHTIGQKHLTIDAPAIIIPFTPAFGFSPSTEAVHGHNLIVPDTGEDILQQVCILRV